jgi:[ribosomal protein S5]-alanine N-acetyltransferase
MGSVRLVPVTSHDEKEFIAAAKRSRDLHRPWVAPPLTSASFQAMVERGQGPANHALLVRHRKTGALVGFIHISNIIRGLFQSGYLGYYAFAGHERQGLMKEALRLTARTAFSQLKLHRLEANIQPTNVASIALVRSCGFKKEGFSPKYLKIAGRWRDHERWALLAS